MDQDHSEMESRLNDVLSRIAMETQEIKELEQQLTDGQILANEALKRDLEEVISGLQQYLKSLRAQTNKAQVNAQSLQAENQSVRRHLRDTQRHYRRLEEQATAHTQLMAAQQDDLSMLHSEAASLRDAQVHMEAELQHLRAELDCQSDQFLLQQTICDLQTRLERFASESPDHSSSLRVEDLSRSKSQPLDQSLSEGRHRNLHRLNRKLQEQRRVMCENESLTGEQLLWAVHQVKELNRSVDRLKGRLDDGEARSELTEAQAQVDRAWTKTRTESRCKAGAESGQRTRPDREEAPRSRAPVRLTTVSVGSGATLDSGLDLHLLSSPERALTTGAAGNWHHQQHHHQHHLTETDPSEEGGSTEAEPAGGAHTQVEKKRLRAETEKLQRALRKHRRVLGVCEEVWCVEQTLMKRRAELREAQRLLQEAHSSTAKARHEAEKWARRAKDSATCLQRTQVQLRELQDAAEAHVQILDRRDLIQSLDSENQQGSLRIQEKLQQRIQELRSQESRVKSTLEALEQQQEALLSQKSSADQAAAEEEQRLERLRTELDSARIELKQVLEEVLLERQELVRLKTLRSQHFTKLQETQNQLDQAKDHLDQTRDQLDQTRDQLDQTKDQLDQTRDEADQSLEETRRKEEELNEKQKELDLSQAAADRKRAELTVLEQEVEMLREEAESRLKEKEQQQKELQVLKEEVERTTEQSSSLHQQCRHLEDRRRHAHRCLSAVEAELERLRQEQSQSLLTQQEVKKETAASQDKLNESSELLCFLGEKLEEKKVQLQTLQQELSVLSEKQQQKQELDQSREVQEENRLNHREMSAAGTECKDRGRCVTRESEELREREERLLRREAELQLKEELLKQKEELRRSGAEFKEEEEELKSDLEDSDGASSEDFYLSTAGLRSASSPEEQMWRVELETDKLKFEEDSLKARLRSSLQTRRHRLQERGLEAEQSVRGLRNRVERLDSLLLRAETQE